MANLFAKLAKPRLMQLLKLRDVEHVYDPAPGRASAKFIDYVSNPAGVEILVNKLKTSVQPYIGIERFVSDERVISYIIEPGLIPIVKAILLDVRGRRLLVTRKVGPTESDRGVVAHLAGFGIRIVLDFDGEKNETRVLWECLYGVD